MAESAFCDQIAGILFLGILIFIQVGPFYWLITKEEAEYA